MVVVVVVGADEEGAALLHRHGNRAHVFVKVFAFKHLPASQLPPPSPPSNAEGRTDSEGECAAAQNENAADSEAAVRHKDLGEEGGGTGFHEMRREGLT